MKRNLNEMCRKKTKNLRKDRNLNNVIKLDYKKMYAEINTKFKKYTIESIIFNHELHHIKTNKMKK